MVKNRPKSKIYAISTILLQDAMPTPTLLDSLGNFVTLVSFVLFYILVNNVLVMLGWSLCFLGVN